MKQQCTVEIFKNDCWSKCCTVSIENINSSTAGSSVITFDTNFQEKGQSPSLRYLPQSEKYKLSHWPSFLLDLIPQGDGRVYLQKVLEVSDDSQSDWRMLQVGAINPVGKIRIREAVNAFQDRIKQEGSNSFERGFTTEEILSRHESFAEYFDAHGFFTASATSIHGVSPKLLLTQAKDGLWYADATLPDKKAAKHYIIKFSRARNLADWTILQHEAHYLRLAKEMGLFVAELPRWQKDILFVPRFDRSVVSDKVIRYHQESLASLADLANPKIEPNHKLMVETLRNFVSDPYQATLEYIKRDIMNLALGNTDNSPYNMAVQTINGKTQLAPFYDFAPMYLDMDGISRSLEWLDDNQQELKNWRDIIQDLPFSSEEKEKLRQDLSVFGKRMGNLETLMEQIGVSDDIIMDRYYGIQNQRWQLSEL